MTINNLDSSDRLLTESEAADIIGFSRNTLRAWRVTGRHHTSPPPRFLKCGRAVRYRYSELLDWIGQQSVALTTSELS
ncbi:MAG: helix-turn-helix domain-containing protein [Candidatus Thiodiazotropha endolucinida]|nr:helix-turn-helix domain-containing protein [Candidatus Thiodiazotropha endolucinida]